MSRPTLLFAGVSATSRVTRNHNNIQPLAQALNLKVFNGGQDRVQFGLSRPRGNLDWLLLGVCGLAVSLGCSLGIKSLYDRNQANSYEKKCDAVDYKSQKQCALAALSDENIHIREYGIRRIRFIPISDAEQARLFLKAMRDKNDDLYVTAKEELSYLIPNVKDIELQETLITLYAMSPGFESGEDFKTGKKDNPERLPYSDAYREAETNVLKQLDRLTGKP